MKTMLLNLPFVSSREETIDFKEFCSGGSPEYIKAKKIVAESGLHKTVGSSKAGKSKIGLTYNNAIIGDIENFEVVETTPITLGWPTDAKLRSLKVYSLYINPLALFDVRFALIGATVILVAILEKGIAQAGMVNLAALLSGILRIAFPVVAIGSMIYLISQVGVFL
ncbi:hypothetical protein BLX88_26010 [Bacillus obstructivus]|nr:hypothetical protein BLX88_26010 [Bacillus obstructivus]